MHALLKLDVRPMWCRSEIDVNSIWNRSDTEVRTIAWLNPWPGQAQLMILENQVLESSMSWTIIAHLRRSIPWNLWDLESLWYILENQTLESLRSWVRKVRLGNSQFVIAEILNYICICSHLVQAFGRHGAIDMNGPSSRLVVCGTKAHKKIARHSREKGQQIISSQLI